MAGDCFTKAIDLLIEYDDVKVVHGLPEYKRAGPDQGKRYWHAWVECVVDGVIYAADFSNGMKHVVGRDEYYRIGGIQQVFRYSRSQVRSLVRKHGHAGPWVDGWQGMAELHADPEDPTIDVDGTRPQQADQTLTADHRPTLSVVVGNRTEEATRDSQGAHQHTPTPAPGERRATRTVLQGTALLC